MPFGASGNIYLLGSLGQGLSPILLTPVLTRKLDVTSFGEIIFVTSSASIFGILFSFGLAIAISRTYVLHDESRATINNWFLKFIYTYIFISTFLLLISNLSNYLNIMGVTLIFATMQLILPMTRAQNKAISFAFISFLSATLPIIFVLLNLQFNIIYSNLKVLHFGSIILGISSVFLTKVKLNKYNKIKTYNFTNSLKTSYLVLPHMFSIIGVMNIDKLIFGLELNKSFSGYVQIIMLVGTSPMLLLGALNHAWMYQVLTQLKNNVDVGIHNLNKNIVKLYILSFIFGVFIFIFHKEIINFLNPKIKISQNATFSIILSLLVSFLYICYLAKTHIILWKNKFWIFSITTPLSLLLQSIFILFTVNNLSYLSAAIGLGIAFTFQIILLEILNTVLKISETIKRIYIFWGIFIFWFITFIVLILS